MDSPVAVGFFALCKNNMFLRKNGDSPAASQVVLTAALGRRPNSAPSGRVTGLGNAVDSCLIQLMFLDHNDVKTHGAKENNRFFGASYVGREHF